MDRKKIVQLLNMIDEIVDTPDPGKTYKDRRDEIRSIAEREKLDSAFAEFLAWFE